MTPPASSPITRGEKLHRTPAVQLFYAWLEQSSLSFTQLTFEQLQSFFQETSLNPTQDRIIRSYINLLSPTLPKLLLSKHLPQIAQQFIADLKINLRPNTCRLYGSYIRRFHRFLLSKDLNIESLTRKHMAAFFQDLVDSRLHVATRLGIALHVRVYLRWLYEQRIVRTKPTTLVHSFDFPKLPSYLPRPLPAALDRALQQCLNASPSLLHKALLLMRFTGIRIGELVALDYDCVFIDSREIKFLKVPLGKLNNERNVPLHDRAYELLQIIQRMDSPTRTYLLPRNGCVALTICRQLTSALHQIAQGLDRDAPLTTHRLRHTYATSLLSAGANLFSIMKLLGHRDYHMTLRYAAVTQESVLKDYFAAIKTIDYATPDHARTLPTSDFLDPVTLLDQAQHALKKLAADCHILPASREAFLKKLARLKQALQIALHEKS